LSDVGPNGFANCISIEKYLNLCRVSRATAYRELMALCEMGVLVQTGTRYLLSDGFI
jgi:predicted DNA-binding transcriptional regulator YafY